MWDRPKSCPLFTEEETEVQRNKMIPLREYTWEVFRVQHWAPEFFLFHISAQEHCKMVFM